MARDISTIDPRGGFTLVESLIASTVLAVCVVAIIGPVSAACRQSEVSQNASGAVTLARQLIDEIAARPIVDPTDQSQTLGPEPGESSRILFDNIDDYHGYQDRSDALADLEGRALLFSGDTIYQRTVTVEYRNAPDGNATVGGLHALIVVRVDVNGVEAATLRRLASAYPRNCTTIRPTP